MTDKKPHQLHIAIRFIVFAILFLLAVYAVNRLLMPKYLYDSASPVTETYNGFYHMQKDTVDVVILGTSQAATSMNPQAFYNAEQVRAYNLASSMQNLRDSYYWMKEALKTQKPRAVILEVYNLFNDATGEVPSRNALDYMKNDEVKAADVKETVDENPDWSALSYYLTNIRYHTRWQELEENDFGYGITETPSVLKGYWNFTNVYGGDDFTPLAEPDSDIGFRSQLSSSGQSGSSNPGEAPQNSASVMAPGAQSYLKRLVSLCRENDCELILVKAPWNAWTMGNHLAVRDFAEENGLSFYDFNTEELYKQTDFQYAEDIDDSNNYGAHCNASGAKKLSRFLAKELVSRNICSPEEDFQWEETREENEKAFQDFVLVNTQDAEKWVSLLGDKRYTVIISKRGGSGNLAGEMPENFREFAEALGLSFDSLNAAGQNYAAVIEKGNILEQENSSDPIDYQGSLRGGRVRLEVVSGSDTASIRLDGEEQAKGSDGINIVVYHNDLKKVIDSVVISPESSGADLVR